MAIKKAFQPIMNLLAANEDKKVKTILAEVEELCSAKSGGGGGQPAFHKDEAGNVVALHCSYHKKWFRPGTPDEEGNLPEGTVEFGAKKSSASGYNTMSKDGSSKWTKQLAQFKKAKEQLLEDVGNGEVSPSDIPQITADLEAARHEVVPMDDIQGFETLEELLASL